MGDRIIEMLRATGRAQERLFAEARAVRESVFGRYVVVRGVVEVTNRCRVDCTYCPMRRSSTSEDDGYVLEAEQLVDAARAIRGASLGSERSDGPPDVESASEFPGINVVFIQGGELPRAARVVQRALPRIRALFRDRVEILLSLGSHGDGLYKALRSAGATSYILKHETSDPLLHREHRGENFEDRLDRLRVLRSLGFKVGTGTIVGLPGQTLETLAEDVILVGAVGASMTSASPFIPASGTPLEASPHGSIDTTLNTMAAMRILYPEALIPAVSALEKLEPGGQFRGLSAGANVVTVNFTPSDSRERYSIYGRDRFVVHLEHVRALLSAAGLRARGSLWA